MFSKKIWSFSFGIFSSQDHYGDREADSMNHRYETSEQALNSGDMASYGVLYLPPSAGLFD